MSFRLAPTNRLATSCTVMMALTPGKVLALEVLIFKIRACGKGLRRTLPQRIPGRSTSAVYLVRPVTFSGPSTLGMGCPTGAFGIVLDKIGFEFIVITLLTHLGILQGGRSVER